MSASDIELPFVTYPDEKPVAGVRILYRDEGESFYWDRRAYLSTARLVGYDNKEGILFSQRYKDIQRAEVGGGAFFGWEVNVMLENASSIVFKISMSIEQGMQVQAGQNPDIDIRMLTQRWANLINEYVIIHRSK